MNHLALSAAAGQPATMSSREIAELTAKEHKNVTRDIEKMLAELEEDALRFEHIYFDSMNRPQTEYLLDRELTETLLTGYSAVLRRKVIARWRELESTTKVLQLPDFTNPAESARAWALEYEEKTKAQHALALAAPKVAFVDNYVSAETGSLGLRQVCKLLSAKQNEFTAFLIARQVMYRTTPKSPLQPRAEHMHSGRFEAKTGIAEHEESAHAFVQYKFTAKGVEWIAGEWAKHNVRKEIQL